MDNAILPEWGNSGRKVVKIRVSKGVKFYEGVSESQRAFLGGGDQIYFKREVLEKWMALLSWSK